MYRVYYIWDAADFLKKSFCCCYCCYCEPRGCQERVVCRECTRSGPVHNLITQCCGLSQRITQPCNVSPFCHPQLTSDHKFHLLSFGQLAMQKIVGGAEAITIRGLGARSCQVLPPSINSANPKPFSCKKRQIFSPLLNIIQLSRPSGLLKTEEKASKS